jgi:hypothetical protein
MKSGIYPQPLCGLRISLSAFQQLTGIAEKRGGPLEERVGDVFSNFVQARLRRDLKMQRQLRLPKQRPDAPLLVSFGVFRGYILKADAMRHVVS